MHSCTYLSFVAQAYIPTYLTVHAHTYVLLPTYIKRIVHIYKGEVTCMALLKNLTAVSNSRCTEKQFPSTHHVCGAVRSRATSSCER